MSSETREQQAVDRAWSRVFAALAPDERGHIDQRELRNARAAVARATARRDQSR